MKKILDNVIGTIISIIVLILILVMFTAFGTWFLIVAGVFIFIMFVCATLLAIFGLYEKL